MIIRKIKLENIRSFENLELEFPKGSTLLAGDIGSGKTTILLAIEFALFGLQPGQKGSSLLKSGEKQGSVILEVDIEGKQVILERQLKRGKSITQDCVVITVDGIKQEKSILEIKNQVLTLLNYPIEFAKKTNLLYKFTVYTPQEEMKQIILENPETRLNTLRHVFGIDKYKRIKENTYLFAVKLREEIRNKQGFVQDLDEKQSKIKEKLDLLDKLNNDSQGFEKIFKQRQENRKKIELELEEIEKNIEQKKNFEREVEKTKILFSGKREMTINNENEIKNLKQQIEDIKKLPFNQDEINSLRQEKQTQELQKEEINKKYLEISGQISSLNLRTQENEKLKQQILKIKLCPTCLQNVDNNYKENIISKFDKQNRENNTKIQELDQEKTNIIQKIGELRARVTEIEKKVDELNLLKAKLETLGEKQKRMQELDKNKQSLEKDINLLEKHVETLKVSILEFSKYDNLYNRKEQDFKSSLQLERETDIKIAELKKETQLNRSFIEELVQEINKKQEIKRILTNMIEIEQWLSERFLYIVTLTERNVLLKLREEFSKLFNEWFNILVPDIFTVRLDEDFTPIIEQQDYELDYSFLSGGERTAIALAYRLALNQTINSLLSKIKTKDLVILDEPTDGFSEQQLDKMRDVLAQLNVNQLILVSHEQKIESFVENIIKFKKEAGVSRIEQET